MSRAFDFASSGVIVIIAAVIHRVSVALFDTDTPLYAIATEGTGAVNGSEKAAMWSEFFILWLPLLMFGFAIAYLTVKEFKRQTITARQQVR